MSFYRADDLLNNMNNPLLFPKVRSIVQTSVIGPRRSGEHRSMGWALRCSNFVVMGGGYPRRILMMCRSRFHGVSPVMS